MQATGKTIFLELLRLHIATGGNGYHGNGLRLGQIRRTQQFQQVETVDGRHLYIGEQHIKGIGTQGIQQFVQLHARYRSDAAMLEHGCGKRKLNAVVVNQQHTERRL